MTLKKKCRRLLRRKRRAYWPFVPSSPTGDTEQDLILLEHQRLTKELYTPCPRVKIYDIPRSFPDCCHKSQQAYLYLHSNPSFIATQDHDSKRLIVGVHDRHLPLIELWIRKVGTKFIPPYKPLNRDPNELEIVGTIREDFTAQVQWYIFWNNRPPVDNADDSYNPKFHAPTDRNPPEFPSNISQLYFRIFTAFLHFQFCIMDERQPKSRHQSKVIVSRLQRLQRDAKIIVKAADKNLGITFMSVEWYLDQVRSHLHDTTAYRYIAEIGSDAATACSDNSYFEFQRLCDALLTKDIAYMKYTDCLSKQMVRYIKLTKVEDFQNFPEFHVIPKMHKNPPSSRPIVPTHSWGTMRLSKVLSFMLRPFLKHTPWVVKDIAAVKEQLLGFRMLPDTEYAIVTGDVSSLYTNIPLPDGYKAIRELTRTVLQLQYPAEMTGVNRFRRDMETSHMVDFYSNMTRFVMLHNYFRSGNRLFQQIKGTAMGTNMAPEFANIYMAVAEQAELFNLNVIEGCLYLRYIDDILIVGPRDKLDRMVLQTDFLNLPLTINWL